MYNLSKSERLCSKISTTELFSKGSSINEEPFRIIFLASDFDRDVYFKSQFIVPKRHITRAVDRNLIKRQMKEAFRKNKILLIDFLKANAKQLNFAIIYQISEIQATSYILTRISTNNIDIIYI